MIATWWERRVAGARRRKSQVALLRFGERPWRCTKPPRNATEGIGQSIQCQSERFGSFVALEKTDLSSQPVVAPELAAPLRGEGSAQKATGVPAQARLTASFGELFRSATTRL